MARKTCHLAIKDYYDFCAVFGDTSPVAFVNTPVLYQLQSKYGVPKLGAACVFDLVFSCQHLEKTND